MSAARGFLRPVAAGAALGALLLAGCGGSDEKKPKPRATQPPADRTQHTEAGARATLREYAAAFTSSDAKRTCDLLDPTVVPLKSASKQRCRREVGRLEDTITPQGAAALRQGFAALKPAVSDNVATLPGNDNLSLRYIDGRWYVRLAPSDGSATATSPRSSRGS